MKKISRVLSILLSISLIFMCAACGAKTEYESYYEDVPGEVAGGDETTVSDNDTQSEAPKESNGTQSKVSSGSTSTANPTVKDNMTPDEFLDTMPTKLRGSTIKMFFWDDLRSTVYKTALNKFQQKTGIKVEIEVADKPTYQSTLAARISAGKSPDVVMCEDNNVGTVSNLQPITNSGYNFKDNAWDKKLMQMFTYNGKCYAVNVQDSPNKNIGIIVYNKKALKRANLSKDDPYTLWKSNPSKWNWSKFWSMCDAFVKANGGKEGYYGSTWGTEDGYVNAFGVSLWRYDGEKGKTVNESNTAESIKRYGEIVDAINKKWSTSVVDVTGFESGKILFSWTYSSTAEKMGVGNESLKKGNNLGFVPMPTDSTHTPMFTTCAYGIPVGAKNAAAVPYFLRYIYSPESLDEDEFYFNEEAKTVVKSVISKNEFFFGNGYNYAVWQDMIKGTGANVKSVIDSYQGMINDTVKIDNNNIAKLHK